MQILKKKIKLFVLFVLTFVVYENTFSLNAEWSSALPISSAASSVNPNGTPLIINSYSRALVGWLNGIEIGDSQTLSSASLPANFPAWTDHQTIYNNNLPKLFPTYPSMSEDRCGNQLAFFGHNDLISGYRFLNASRRVTGASKWLIPIQQIGNRFTAESVATDDLGNFALFLGISVTQLSPYAQILFQLPEGSSSWSQPLYLALDYSVHTTVAVRNYNGQGFLAWKISTPSLQIQTVRYDFINQIYSDVINAQFPSNTLDIIKLDLALDHNGNAILLYSARTSTAEEALFTTTLSNGEVQWTDPVLISDPAHRAINQAIASDGNGNTTIVWTELISDTQQFARAASLPFNSSTPIFVTNLSRPNLLNTTIDWMKVVSDSFGNAVTTWSMTTNGSKIVYAAAKRKNNIWDVPDLITLSGHSSLVALSDQGTSVVTWIGEGSNILLGSRNLSLFPLESPTNFVGRIEKNKFATQKVYFLKFSWDPSASPHITNYYIVKNEKIIATIPGDQNHFKKKLKSKKISGTYYLIAEASNGNRSEPVPLQLN